MAGTTSAESVSGKILRADSMVKDIPLDSMNGHIDFNFTPLYTASKSSKPMVSIGVVDSAIAIIPNLE